MVIGSDSKELFNNQPPVGIYRNISYTEFHSFQEPRLLKSHFYRNRAPESANSFKVFFPNLTVTKI